jgi:acetyl-CoA C-acetyltransferase
MVTGLVRIAEAASQVMGAAGAHQVPGVRRALAHASTGHAMQQNAVFLLEGDA